jgi:hypothetical protein
MRAKVVGLPPPSKVLMTEYSGVPTIITSTIRIGQQMGVQHINVPSIRSRTNTIRCIRMPSVKFNQHEIQALTIDLSCQLKHFKPMLIKSCQYIV